MDSNLYLKKELDKNGLTLHLLSRSSGVAYATVHGLFTGSKSVREARTDSVRKIADALHMSMDRLYDRLIFEHEHLQPVLMSNFTQMWSDKPVADVVFSENAVHITRHDLHPARQLFCCDEMSLLDFGEIVRSRCWDEHRGDINKLLSMIGLSEYNPYEIAKATHGLMAQDPIWFRFEGEKLSYRDVRRLRIDVGNYD